jgi:hypothetical protein
LSWFEVILSHTSNLSAASLTYWLRKVKVKTSDDHVSSFAHFC